QTPNYYMAAIIIGLVSHVILDMITPRGVKLFYPLPFNVKTPIQFKTGGLVDLSLATALMVGTVYVLFQPFINDIISNWNTKFL
ncbi:TPA: metal-dependent hydrolase, partial [Staphylococcus aureus]|nr:metal-dependent hydrolase [Staphylococcus aureus]HDM4552775.1 metal-dependent hydrolase [Staphylococcus aureus]HDM4555687.1 metal-dependent hydrolase [Staphylococcus aureus]HDM4558410.1 metal-dependent hydrolase [Staphylococcus aureus]HDM4664033.1 metal-dependent hydrolase [Staphylococcus aureus]